MGQYRYRGTFSYSEDDHNLFCGRTTESNDLFQIIKREKTIVLHSKSGCGKTSLLNAGLIPKLKTDKKYHVFTFKLNSFIDNKSRSPFEILIQTITPKLPNNSYVDKIISKENSLWYYFKKLQGADQTEGIAKTSVIIIDQFEHYFSYPDEMRYRFEEQLSTLLIPNIPNKFSDALQRKLKDSPEFLTKEGLELFGEPVDVRIIFSLQSERLAFISKMQEFLPTILQNVYELKPLTEQQAKEAILFPAFYKSKYVSENNFLSNPFDYSDESIEKIIKFLTKNNNPIDSFQLQTLCLYAENIVIQNNLTKITADDLGDIENIYLNFYENSLLKIENDSHRDLARKLIEEALVFDEEKRRLKVYEGILLKNFNIEKTILEKLVDCDILKLETNSLGETYYEVAHDALVMPILKAKFKRKEIESKIEQANLEKETLRILNEKQAQKAKVFRKIFIITAIAFVITLIFGIIAQTQKQKALTNERIAKSNMLSAYAFQEIQTDPTISLRLAEAAFENDKENPSAYSALLNAYYRTNTFYNILFRLNRHIASARLSPDCNSIIMPYNNSEKGIHVAQIISLTDSVIREFKHNDDVTFANFSPDGKLVITTSTDKTAKLWDISGNLILTLTGHEAFVWTAAFSYDSKKIITGSGDKTAILWSIEGKKLAVLKGHELDVYSAEFSRDGKYIVTSSYDNSARLWDINGKLLKTITVKDQSKYTNISVMYATFSPDGKYILTANNDLLNQRNSIRRWDLNGVELRQYLKHDDWVNYIWYTNDGKYFLSASRDKTVRLWDTCGKEVRVLKGHEEGVLFARLMPDGENVITISEDKTVRVWNIDKLNEPFKEKRNINFATISADGLSIITASNDTASVWDLLGTRLLTLSGHTKKINTAIFSPDGKSILTAGNDKTARLWNLEGKQLSVFQGHTNKINTAYFSFDGKYIVTASDDSTAAIWDLSGKKIKLLDGHKRKVNSARFSTNDYRIITAGDDSTAIIWDLEGNKIKTIKGHDGGITSASFSPDGQTILTVGTDKVAMLWNNEGKNIKILKGYSSKMNSAEFSNDGKYIVTTSDDRSARLWNFNGKEIMAFLHEDKVYSATFAPNGKYIITVYLNSDNVKTIKLWLVNADDILHRLKMKPFGNIWQLDKEAKHRFGIE